MRPFTKTLRAALVGAVLLGSPAFGAPRTDFVVANQAEPLTLDPALARAPQDLRIVGALFEGLVGWSAQGTVVPALAQSWTVSADGRTYLFRLRKALWSDGIPLTAATVKASWQRVLDPKTGSWRAELVRRFVDPALIVPVDALTLKVTFLQRLPAVSLLADPAFAAVPVHAVARYGDAWAGRETLVVNGPYALGAWRPYQDLTLVPNPRYWDPKAVRLAKVVFVPLGGRAGYRAYLKGDVDWVPSLPGDLVPGAQDLRGFHAVALPSVRFLRVNTLRPALGDPRVRQALALALDRSALGARLPLAPLTSFTPPLRGYTPPQFAGRGAPAAAKLLADAGYPGGQGLPSLTLVTNASDQNLALAEWVRDQWSRNLGVAVELRSEDWKAYLSDRASLNYDVLRGGWAADYNDPLTFLELWTSDHPENGTGYSNPAYDALVAQARLAGGPTRTKLLVQAEALVLADLPFIPLGADVVYQLIDLKRWSGWAVNALDVHPWKGLGPAR